MELGQAIHILSRLILGAMASFLAIMLWPRIRDTAWIFIIIGTITAYVETVYSILNTLGINSHNGPSIGSVFLIPVILTCLPMIFFVAAFTVMVIRKYRRQ